MHTVYHTVQHTEKPSMRNKGGWVLLLRLLSIREVMAQFIRP